MRLVCVMPFHNDYTCEKTRYTYGRLIEEQGGVRVAF